MTKQEGRGGGGLITSRMEGADQLQSAAPDGREIRNGKILD